jgi:hypothetical protein
VIDMADGLPLAASPPGYATARRCSNRGMSRTRVARTLRLLVNEWVACGPACGNPMLLSCKGGSHIYVPSVNRVGCGLSRPPKQADKN